MAPLLMPWISRPPAKTLARVVTPVWRSYTKTSRSLLVSSGTRFDADEVNATYRPFPEIVATYSAQSLAGCPSRPPLTSVVVPVRVSRTKTSVVPLTSSGTRLSEVEAKATYRPSSEMSEPPAPPLPGVPSGAASTRAIVPDSGRVSGHGREEQSGHAGGGHEGAGPQGSAHGLRC